MAKNRNFEIKYQCGIFLDNFRSRIKEKHSSFAEMQEYDIDSVNLSRWLSGRVSPTLFNLVKVLDALDLELIIRCKQDDKLKYK